MASDREPGAGLRVAGRCPACRRESLSLGRGGHVTCNTAECSHPSAADDLLHLDQNHVVEFHAERYHLEHPAICRLGGRRLVDCPVEIALEALSGPPCPLGSRYLVSLGDDGLAYEEAG